MKNESLLKKFGISKLLPKTSKAGTAPGVVNYLGRKKEHKINLHVFDYNENDFTEKDIDSIKESAPFKKSPNVTWLNISGVHDEKLIHDVGEYFEIHPLILSDIANTTQRPKIEEYDDYLFIVLKMVYFDEVLKEIIIEQVSLIVKKDFIISFQEKDGDVLERLRERIRSNKGKVRKLGSDYLLYAIADSIVDNYFLVLEQISEEIEKLEEQLLKSADQEILNKIYRLKQELIFLRKSIWPTREVINTLQRAEHELISDETAIYLRDVYDHTIQVVETTETFRDMVAGMLDLYLSTVSNKMNEVMKVLTIFAAIFIPLTFLAGVYGMNFEFMPELKWRLAYPIWWVVTIVLTVGMIKFFRRKKWF